MLIPLSLVLVALAAGAFAWAAHDGQLDGDEADAARALRDDEPPVP